MNSISRILFVLFWQRTLGFHCNYGEKITDVICTCEENYAYTVSKSSKFVFKLNLKLKFVCYKRIEIVLEFIVFRPEIRKLQI